MKIIHPADKLTFFPGASPSSLQFMPKLGSAAREMHMYGCALDRYTTRILTKICSHSVCWCGGVAVLIIIVLSLLTILRDGSWRKRGGHVQKECIIMHSQTEQYVWINLFLESDTAHMTRRPQHAPLVCAASKVNSH